MKTLPKIRRETAPDWQRERLARWLQEWELDRSLSPAESTDIPAPARPLTTGGRDPRSRLRSGAHQGFRPAERHRDVPLSPEVGQIRLLYPEFAHIQDRLLYVAAIEDQRPGALLVAPFGRFAEPAVPGEWSTGRPDAALRILALWNARGLSTTLLEKSWRVDLLSEAELAKARAVHRALHESTPLPAELESQVGPPLVHPLDPRHEYLAIEKVVMDGLVEIDRLPVPRGALKPSPDDAELSLAAETQPPYGAVRRLRIGGSGLLLHITETTDPSRRRVAVVDAQGQPSEGFDGAALQAPNGEQSPPIAQSATVVPARLLQQPSLQLVADDGSVYEIVEEPLLWG